MDESVRGQAEGQRSLDKAIPAQQEMSEARPSAVSGARASSKGPVVTFYDDVGTLKDRIAKAESERESWRISGMQEKYLEACSMVDALALQLERAAARSRARR